MKKRNSLIALGALFIVLSLGLLTTCGEIYKPHVLGINLNKGTHNLKVNEVYKLEYSTRPSSAKKSVSVKWESDDTNVATVDDNGNVHANDNDIYETATITAKIDNSSAVCLITVCKNIYTVTFDKNGGDTEANPNEIVVRTPHETNVGILPIPPYRKSFIFKGWVSKDENENESPFDGLTPVNDTNTTNEKIIVYAKWASFYTVLFDENPDKGGGTKADPPKIDIVEPADRISLNPSPYRNTLPTPPNRKVSPETGSLVFDGWNTSKEGDGDSFDENTPVNDTNTVNGKITVYAKWRDGLSPPSSP